MLDEFFEGPIVKGNEEYNEIIEIAKESFIQAFPEEAVKCGMKLELKNCKF